MVKMIIVNLRPTHRSQVSQTDDPYLGVGMVNWRLNVRPHLWRPPTDLFETEEKYIVRVEISGMSDADFNISADQSMLTVSGVRPDPSNDRRAFHQMEISYGEFFTQVELPANIERNNIEADYQDGFLRIILPKAQAKQIHVTKEA